MSRSRQLLRCLVVCSAAVGAVATSSGAQAQGLITCWYNEKNVYTGADTAQPGTKLGLVRTDPSGDYAWAYTIRANDGTSSPRTRPQQ